MASTTADEWRSHWRVVAGSAIGIASGYSAWQFAASSFVIPLQQEFGWSRGQMALAYNLNILAAFLAPIIGHIVDFFGVRPVLLTALAVLGVDYIAFACMTGSLTLYYVLYAVMVLFGIATSGITFARSIASRFNTSRGLAFSVSRLGLVVTGAGLPILLYTLISAFGWRTGFGTMAALALLVGLPFSWIWVHDRKNPDILPDAFSASADNRRLWIAILTDRRVIALAVGSGFAYAPLLGIVGQLQPILVGRGIAPGMAAELGGILAVAVLAGTVGTGVLVDYFWAPLVVFVTLLGPVLGCWLLASFHATAESAGASVFLIGLALGAEINVLSFLISRYFGMRAFSTIYGIVVMVMSLFSAAGGVLFGQAYDLFGGYREALWASSLCFGVSSIVYLFMGRYPTTPELGRYQQSSILPSIVE